MAVPTPRELELAAQLSLLAKERDAAMEKCAVAMEKCAEAEARGLRLEEQINQLVRTIAQHHPATDRHAEVRGEALTQLGRDRGRVAVRVMSANTPGWSATLRRK